MTTPGSRHNSVPKTAAAGVYVHIPFCQQKCPYCEFVAGTASSSQQRAYLDALAQEIRQCRWRANRISTVFFGGGTPSLLQPPDLAALVAVLRETFSIDQTAEWTLECNPETRPRNHWDRLRELGFNRVSWGVQSFHDGLLETLGRSHRAEQAVVGYRQLRDAGFDNINLDLLFGIPGQSIQHWQADLQKALELDPDHLSLYNLTVAAGTEFGRLQQVGSLREADPAQLEEMFEYSIKKLLSSCFRHYEISHFARPGKECLHNLTYWRSQPYLGFGIGAASFLAGRRWTNVSDLQSYTSRLSQGRSPRAFQEKLPPREAMGESIMLGLGTAEGIDLDQLEKRHGLLVPQPWLSQLESWCTRGYLTRADRTFRLTHRGRISAQDVTASFLT